MQWCSRARSLKRLWVLGPSRAGIKTGRHKDLQSQWVHVAVWYMSGPERNSYVLTFGPMYVPYRYLDPLGLAAQLTLLDPPKPVPTSSSRGLDGYQYCGPIFGI